VQINQTELFPSISDWISFRQHGKMSEYYKKQFSISSSNLRTFWKTVKELENTGVLTQGLLHLTTKILLKKKLN